jgi:hypothetical protein
VLAALMMAALEAASLPRPAPHAFVSTQYGLTFRSPVGSSYCALPGEWVGSDHGTVIFLAPPTQCHGAGFPSSGRGFDGNPARIEVFYAYDVGADDDAQPPPSCHQVGHVDFLGKVEPLCRTTSRHEVEVSVTAKYQADTSAEAILTLVTTPDRLEGDLKKFRGLLESARICTATWHDDKGGAPFTMGSGPPCPKGARYF